MRPMQAIQAVKLLVSVKQPVMLSGSPGVGKSDVVRQAAKELGIQLIDLRLSQMDPVDLRGIPSVDRDSKTTSWNVPDFFPRDPNSKGILFLDEINSAAQATQAAAYQLVLDRQLGDYTLPEGWSIVAAGNRTKDGAIVNQMSSALKNRFAHIDYEVSNDDWTKWALQNNISPEIIGFLRFRPMNLNEFEVRNSSDEERKRVQQLKNVQAFATPRSWEFLSRVIAGGVDKDMESELFAGIVGEGCAAEFMGYMKYYRNLPNLDMLLLDPNNAEVPTEPAVLYALSAGLASRANVGNFENVCIYAGRIPAEFQAMLVKDAVMRDSSLVNTHAFTKWAANNSEILL